MASVTLTGVRKVYHGGVEAVRGVSFEVPDGQFCVLVGPSGCGKSTLLRMIAGLETISGGDVQIADRRVNDVEPAERDIAMVFQNYALYPHMSVYDNMAYGLRNRGTPKAEIETRVREAAKILAIEPFLERRPKALSGGQRQRVAMGRAIVRKPQVFLFDEPLSNLDAKLRVQMRVEIKRLQRALGVTSIYVTHDQVEAMTLSDILVVMNGGNVEQIGTPIDLYRRPETRFVAGFIGSPGMNFLPGTLRDPSHVEVAGRILPLAEPCGVPAGAKVEVGIRPEDIRVVPAGEGKVDLAIEFTEELGATQLIHGRVGGAIAPAPKDAPVVDEAAAGLVVAGGTPATVQVAAGGAREIGTIGLDFEPRALHLFDAAGGHRL